MNRKLATYVCYAIMMVFAINLTIISPLLMEISRSFSLNMAQAGVIFTAEFAGFVAFILIGGILSDKLGKRTVSAFSLIGLSISLLLFPLSPNYFTACIIMVFAGGFGGAIESVVTALVSDLNEFNNSFYVNLSQVFFGIGAVLGPVIAGVIIASGISWRMCYFVVDSLLIALTILFLFVKMNNIPKQEGLKLSDFKALFNDRKFLLICACMFFYTGAEVGGWGWISTFLRKVMSFSIVESSVAVGVFWAAMTIGRLYCGKLTLRFKLGNIILMLAFLSSFVTFLSVFVGSKILIWCIIAAMGFTYSSQWPLIASYGSRQTSAPSGTVFAILIGSGGVGSMTIPLLMGVIGEKSSLRFAMIIPCVLLLLVGLIFLRFKQGERVLA